MNNKANRSRNTPNHGRLLPMLLAVIAVLLIALLAFFLTQGKSSGTEALDNLPNYTDVKGKIVVDGLKYEKQPHLGSESAKVKVIEFADFKCPACKNWTASYLDTFIKDYVDSGKVQFYFMNFAFIDRDSYLAASAGKLSISRIMRSSGSISTSSTRARAMRARSGQPRSSSLSS